MSMKPIKAPAKPVAPVAKVKRDDISPAYRLVLKQNRGVIFSGW